ncbi:molybdopterin-dependent oxidoreductase [Paraburkholderia sp. CNPSo 3076]|uniref:xanthine dehydrogenase family protein molybdopterin-binding subunit n=1 Tax=Paraburkholderia sp. CNPSo 3076 TaxID=2940936 RepID=UPI00224D0390|nr:molybdopterin cofactor-binding domain-containing protein [Paraburkholderia sp. CNPSo 3076]MCX5544206.1 molybdopterin-dependent oxidoreductase [Paraburkholderia sp. CNPSo 3076]
MASEYPVSRRAFLKVMGGGVITVSVSTLPVLMSGCVAPQSDAQHRHRGTSPAAPADAFGGAPDWAPEPGKARWRIDGLRKVTGAKIYARDYKASDFDGWPKQENWLYAVRCNRVDRKVEGIDLSVLPPRLKPSFVVCDDTLKKYNIPTAQEKNPEGSQDIYLFAQKGSPAGCYGQPVALLIFENFDTYRRARKLLDFNDSVVRYGEKVTRKGLPADPFNNHDLFKDSKLYVRDDESLFWNTGMDADDNGNPTKIFKAKCEAERQRIREAVRGKVESDGWQEFGTSNGVHFRTPALDPAFMEPEAGLAWLDPNTGHLHLVLGTQSPAGDGRTASKLFKGSHVNVKHVHVFGCYPGGGFGGRDSSWFPMYLALAAPFAKGPLRWQLSRFEQFQVGLKRSETEFIESIWIDKKGKLQALDCQFLLNAGGKQNLTPSVGNLAAMSAMSCYDIPRACAESATTYTPEVFGGSQRGFGGPQAFMAIETLMDEAAQALNKSPFDIRRDNLLVVNTGRTLTGGKVLFDLQLAKLLDELEKHDVWRDRERVRAERGRQNLRYGVGLAMSNHAYGTGKDGVFAMVEIQQDASLRVRTNHTDMGNGAATTLGLAPSWHLGQNAQEIVMSEVDAFSINGVNPATMGLWPGDGRAKGLSEPFGSSSACLGAFHHFEAVDRAAKALMLQSVLPAARRSWGNQRIALGDVKWVNGKLTAAGYPPLSWPVLLDEINRMGWPTVAAVHVTYSGGFWQATYPFNSGKCELDCDFVAMGHNVHDLNALAQESLKPPKQDTVGYGRTNYAPAAALVALSVTPDTGQVTVEHVVTSLSAGRVLCREIVEGQSEGAVAMAIGNVLTERCPLGPDGPGNGRWNFDRYLIARMRDIPAQDLITLPPPDDEYRHCARGVGEAVMCPLAPAILNALAMATGHRFRRTPVTPEMLREALK